MKNVVNKIRDFTSSTLVLRRDRVLREIFLCCICLCCRRKYFLPLLIWAATSENITLGMCVKSIFLVCLESSLVKNAITKTYLYHFDPLKSHFYIVKLWFTGYILFCLFLLKNINFGYSLEPPRRGPPRRGGSNEYTQFMFWAKIWKYQNFH